MRFCSLIISLFTLLIITINSYSQTWVDTLSNYASQVYLPAKKYHWTWQNASLLKYFTVCYNESKLTSEYYLNYVKTAMDVTLKRANGRRPNAVASGLGLAFLMRLTNDEKYKLKADKIYQDFIKIPRTKEGGVTHLARSPQLWDDTIFMIGMYLMEMYKSTHNEQYLNDLMDQIRIHRNKLINEEWGLWVHGWDGNQKNNCAVCGQRSWPDETTRKSSEIWGRGNGWIVVTLSEILKDIPQSHPFWKESADYLKEMIAHLPELQDKTTGHWYQLPVKKDHPNNFIESSSTAMFAYGILTALQFNLVTEETFSNSISLAYKGLRKYSIQDLGNQYYTTKNVCKGTCIGDESYYLNRKVTEGKAYALAMFMLFGVSYEKENNLR